MLSKPRLFDGGATGPLNDGGNGHPAFRLGDSLSVRSEQARRICGIRALASGSRDHVRCHVSKGRWALRLA
jgi:hypothetical protein